MPKIETFIESHPRTATLLGYIILPIVVALLPLYPLIQWNRDRHIRKNFKELMGRKMTRLERDMMKLKLPYPQ